jgi:NitT/TauT family transport system substrate-binding protein
MKRAKGFWCGGAILACIVLLASCGTQATPTPLPPEPVRLQLQWVTQAQFAGYYVALDKGWYREEGIDLTIDPGGPDLVPSDLVLSGRSDFGTGLLADLVVAAQQGKPVVSVAQVQQLNGLLLVAFKSSGIESPADFAGKRVGVWLGAWEAQFDALMAKQGLTTNDFSLISQGFTMEPFLKGELDVASAMIYNEYYAILESGVKAEDLNIINYADYGLDFPGDTLFTSRQTLENKPDLCERMVRASLRGWQYAVDHPVEAADIVLRYDKSGVQTQGHQLSMMNEIAKLVLLPVRPLGFTDRDSVRRTIDTLAGYGVIDGQVQPEQVFTNDIWEKATKSGQ